MPPTPSISSFLQSLGYIAIPFRRNVAGILLIDAKINYVDGVYILDSGAGRSVVDLKNLEKLKLELKHDEKEMTGGGVGAHGLENVPSYNNTLEIGAFRMDKFPVAVMSLETAWQSLSAVGANEQLTGIIGVDVLNAGKAILDFGTSTLYLLQGGE